MGRKKKTDAQSVSSQPGPRQVGEILNEMLSMREPAGERKAQEDGSEEEATPYLW